MRHLLLALALSTCVPAFAGTPPDEAPSKEETTARKPRPAPKPSGRPSAEAPKPRPPLVEPAPRRPPLAEPAKPPPARAPVEVSPPVVRTAPETEPAKPGPVTRPELRTPVTAPLARPFDPATAPAQARHVVDHRVERPPTHLIVVHPDAHHPPPDAGYYRPLYGGWWVHPYYRWVHVTVVVVELPFVVFPWDVMWFPPARPGWVWVPGVWYGPIWVPGHWEPLAPPPYLYGASYAYVPGFWYGDHYVEGYWRVVDRPGWVWVDTRYVGHSVYWGHWEPAGPFDADGYVWEPGYWNGTEWVEGFWRPEARPGYRWVSAGWDASGLFHAGYWEPLDNRPGYVWIPGWFDGTRWISGYWVTVQEYEAADPESWRPAVGWDEAAAPAPVPTSEPPLAIPVD